MGSIFSYALASSLFLCIGYLAYKWIMAGERQHSCNRLTLYIIYIFALTLPAAGGEWESLFQSENSVGMIGEIETDIPVTGLILKADTPRENTPAASVVFTAIYLAGMILTLAYSIAGACPLATIIRKGEKIKDGKYTLVISDRKDIAPFSWLRYYVMSRDDYESAGNIISIHERRHLKLLHWADLTAVQAICIFQWFNPAAWLMAEEFKTVHEYQADDAVLASGTNIRQYQTLLIKKAVGTRFRILANSLNHSKLKKRITMMYKSNPPKSRRMGAFALIPAMAIGCAVMEIPAVAAVLDTASETILMDGRDSKVTNFSTISDNESTETVNILPTRVTDPEAAEKPVAVESVLESPSATLTEEKTDRTTGDVPTVQSDPAVQHDASYPADSGTSDYSAAIADDNKKKEVFTAVEEQAEFPGGLNELMKWLSDNVKYPENAFKNGVQGRVIVKFIIEKDGKIGDASILKGIDPQLDNEALRVVKEMPAWQPAKVNGEVVASYFNLPVTFRIKDDNKEKKTDTPAN